MKILENREEPLAPTNTVPRIQTLFIDHDYYQVLVMKERDTKWFVEGGGG
jgi:hypothetical protein